ncbi:GntR family transcriptional regulator [Bacillus daqingensis]|uniref:GntR family transcriptional regulator n=1 Tax=Bacillus daqingensis TaxID=872396 RepID=A0ABV9NU66_9BACI
MNNGANTDVFNRLYQLITTGYFRAGEKLREREIAELLQVSRTPVRQAFHKLERQGLIVSEEKRGVRIPTFSEKQIHDLYEMREILEVSAAQMLAVNRNEEIISAMRVVAEEAAGAETPKEQSLINNRFHHLLMEGADNEYLLQAFMNLQAAINVMRATSLSVEGRIHSNVDEHKDIVAALETFDSQKAAEAVGQHIRSSLKQVLQKLKQENSNIHFS